MTPIVWLFRLEAITIRVIHREMDGKAEVVVLGSEGLRKQQVFDARQHAEQFCSELHSELLSKGFTMTWTNAVS
jgi:hypothetical protein